MKKLSRIILVAIAMLLAFFGVKKVKVEKN